MKIEKIYEDNFIKKFHIVIAAAGTGGHIYPGLSIANFFSMRGANVSWMGTLDGMENDLVDKKKYHFLSIPMMGARGKGIMHWFKVPFFLTKAILKAIYELKKIKPDFIILMGGYICFPVAIAAKLLRIHIIIHEQNSVPGMSNKILSYISNKIFLGFESNKLKGELIGNPIRDDLMRINNPHERFEDRIGPLRILIIGGSLGAVQFNRIIPKILNEIVKNKEIKVVHQSGKRHFKDLGIFYESLNIDVEVEDYLHDMNYYYSWADLVIARSGAITVSELSQVGIASILIPYPYAVDNHQYFNAKILEQKKGAVIISQENLEANLPEVIMKLTRKTCEQMAINAKLSIQNSPCEIIYKYCLAVHEG
ncbi:MAG: undecaprenyldiphospho-muramoylpentapeptide beta-N-acetylglucosaminyltransferase [Methylophilaceae bacterium]